MLSPTDATQLRSARELAGLSLAEAAERLGLAPQQLAQLESGLGTEERTREVLATALRGMGEGGRLFHFNGSAQGLRWEQDVPVLREALGEARLQLIRQDGMRAALERRLQLRPTPLRGTSSREAAQQGYLLAGRARMVLGLGSSATLGRWWGRLEERLAIHCRLLPLRSGARAAALLDQGLSAAVIVINSETPQARRLHHLSFAAAHELCHLLFDPAPTATGSVQISVDRYPEGSSKGQRIEARASAFAAELHLPQEGLLELLGTPPVRPETTTRASALELCRRASGHFGSSTRVTINHLCNRRYYDEERREELMDLYQDCPDYFTNNTEEDHSGLKVRTTAPEDHVQAAAAARALAAQLSEDIQRSGEEAVTGLIEQAKTQAEVRAAVTMGRWSLARLQENRTDLVERLLHTIDPSASEPATLLGLLSILYSQREEVEDAWQGLALRIREDLGRRPQWDEARVSSAMAGLL